MNFAMHSNTTDPMCVDYNGNGNTVNEGQQVPSSDPCQTCLCYNGALMCSMLACSPPPNCVILPRVEGECCPRFDCNTSRYKSKFL